MTKATDGPRICFLITPIGLEGSEVRVRSDQVLKHIVAPAAKECGYDTIRADHISEPGIITSQVIQHVVDDPLVVADLTDRNPNVFYELAIRHAIRKPVVQIIHGSETIPFDVAATRTIHFDHHDLDSALRAREDITRQIRAVEKNPNDADTPITVALELQQLRQSDNPLEKSNAEIIGILQEMLEMIRAQERHIAAIDNRAFLKSLHANYLNMLRSALESPPTDSKLKARSDLYSWELVDDLNHWLKYKDNSRNIFARFAETLEDEKKAKEAKGRSKDEGEKDESID